MLIDVESVLSVFGCFRGVDGCFRSVDGCFSMLGVFLSVGDVFECFCMLKVFSVFWGVLGVFFQIHRDFFQRFAPRVSSGFRIQDSGFKF